MNKKETRLSRILRVLFLPLLLIASLSLTACESIVLNQPPNQGNAYPSDPNVSQSLAENFVLTSTSNITRITIWGVYRDAGTAPSTDNFTVIFHADSGGLPATVISTQNNVPVFRQASGGTVGSSVEYIFYLTLATPVTLTPGTYWVEIYNDTTADADDNFYWETGALDLGNGISNSAYSLTVPGNVWFAPGAASIDLAIQMFATRVATAIPTMGEWGIIIFFVLAGLGSVYYLRRQRKA